jgi:molybdopterin molybdotransferase
MTCFESRRPDWLSVGEALRRMLAQAEPLETESLPLASCLGRALAQPVHAGGTLPPWDNAAMDGYAVRARDLAAASPREPLALRVVGETTAGEGPGPEVSTGEAVRIMTGAPVPPGADAVVRVEDTDAEALPGKVWIFSPSTPGRHIRPRGEDMTEGEVLLQAGATLGPGQVGLLAAAGVERVLVHRLPRVGILASGDELAVPGDFPQVLAGRALPESNSPTLAAAVILAGGFPVPLGIARDTPESILEKVELGRREALDVLMTSGGASMGERDLLKRVMEEAGFRLGFWRVKMRPGTPFSFGHLPPSPGGRPLPVLGLPGNPASSFVTFQVLGRPFVRRLAGHRRAHAPVLTARAGEALESSQGMTHFLRVVLRHGPSCNEVFLAGPQASGLVRSQAMCHGLAVIPEGTELVPEGGPVKVLLLDDFGAGTPDAEYLP